MQRRHAQEGKQVTGKDDDATIVDAPRAETRDIAGSMLGATVLGGRYELLGLLGSGGMGTVYRARDTELDELVALKVLKQELATEGGMLERFRREVKLARRVTHRNVARTFDIGEHAGDRFLTMELVEGESLAARAARGRMSPARVVAVAREILEGLAASHEAGVVHGDLKPENILIGKNERVVITDFGISRALLGDANDPRTAAGTLIGTPAYMAPEQVEGARDLDGRADLYALGCMMYRLLTGEPAWSGTSVVSVAAARLLRDPPDPRAVVPDIPHDVAEFVMRCMARDRTSRFASAREARNALAAAAEGAPTTGVHKKTAAPTPPKSVAVLPVTNHGSVDDAYLASGLTDDLIDVLSGIPGIRVRPRGAAARHAELERDPQRIGRALDVDVVVEASLRRAGDLLRITLRVVTVNDGFQLWARRFERPAAAFLSIADEAASEIAGVLASQKISETREAPTDAVALDLYLRGRYVFVTSYFDVGQAVGLLRAAHERAPRDSRIAGMYALAMMRHHAVESLPMTVADDARTIAQAALERDPTVGEARVALALAYASEGDPIAMVRELRRALDIAPDSADALLWTGIVTAEVGRLDDAIALFRRAQAADPSFEMVGPNLARAHALLGDWDTADAIVAQTAGPRELFMAWLVRSRLVLWRGDKARAAQLLAELERAPVPDATRHRIVRILIIARDHDLPPASLETVQRELRTTRRDRRGAFNAQLRVELYARAHRLEEARQSIEELDRLGQFVDLAWIEKCPALEAVRYTAEMRALLVSTRARAERVDSILRAPELAKVG